MKKTLLLLALAVFVRSGIAAADPVRDPIRDAVTTYFAQAFERLRLVAEKKPTVASLRQDMKPLADATKGLFGGTLIDTNFVITQVYFPRDFLARGYDLKKVPQLTGFWKQMRAGPTPQLSEPGHGNLFQPRLIAMRYPVIVDGKLQSIVSVMIRTEFFLEETGLAKMKGYRITCNGVKAEEAGDLSGDLTRFTLDLPATTWLVEYKP
jgi:hypothetical protein